MNATDALEAEVSALDEQLEELRRKTADLSDRRVEAVAALRAACPHARGTIERNDGDYHRPQRWRVCAVCGVDLPWTWV